MLRRARDRTFRYRPVLHEQPKLFFKAARKCTASLQDASLLLFPSEKKLKSRRPNEEVLGLLEQMREDGAPPDSYTYVGVIYGLQVGINHSRTHVPVLVRGSLR